MAASIASSFSPARPSLCPPFNNHHGPIYSDASRFSFKPNYASKSISNLTLPSSGITHAVRPKRAYWSSVVSALVDETPEAYADGESIDSNKGATLDIKLPRRSLQVHFTCNACGERTKRLINRRAYERGVVYAQCAGCLKYHQLADNLGFMVEHDFRETNAESSMDEV